MSEKENTKEKVVSSLLENYSKMVRSKENSGNNPFLTISGEPPTVNISTVFFEILQIFITKNLNIFYRNNSGDSILDLASQIDLSLVEFFFKSIDLNNIPSNLYQKNKFDENFLQIFLRNSRLYFFEETPFCSFFERLINQFHFPLDSRNNLGESALFICAQSSSLFFLLPFFLQQTALDFSLCDLSGKTVFHHLASQVSHSSHLDYLYLISSHPSIKKMFFFFFNSF